MLLPSSRYYYNVVIFYILLRFSLPVVIPGSCGYIVSLVGGGL